MAIHRYLNKATLGGNHCTWWLQQAMIDAGWTVAMSGSGTIGGLYSAVGDVFDRPGANPVQNSLCANPGDWGYNDCWIVLEDPAGNRQLLIQRDATAGDVNDDDWAFEWNASADFAGGAAGTVPTSAGGKGQDIYGSPGVTHAALFSKGGVAGLFHVAADDTASPLGEYGVFCVELVAVDTINAIFMLDDLRNGPTNGDFSAHSLAIYISPGSTVLDYYILYYGTKVVTWRDWGGGGEAWVTDLKYPCLFDGAARVYPGGGMAPASGEISLPYFCTQSALGGFAGVSHWLRMPAVERGYNHRSISELYWYMGDCLIQNLPDGVTVPANIP